MRGLDQVRDANADRRIESWLSEGPERAGQAFVESTLAPIPQMAQRRRSLVAFGRISVRVDSLARYAAAASILVAVTAAGAFLLRTPNGSGGPSPAPSPTAALTSGLPFADEMTGGMGSEPGAAGTYQTRQFRPRLVFTVPSGWSIGNLIRTFVGGSETEEGLPLTNGAGEIVITTPSSVDPPAPGDPGSAVPTDLIAWLGQNRQLSVGSPTPVTISGLPGREIEGTLAPTATLDATDQAYRPFDALVLLPRHQFRIVVITVSGQQVVIATVANADSFDAFRIVADRVIASFAFPG